MLFFYFSASYFSDLASTLLSPASYFCDLIDVDIKLNVNRYMQTGIKCIYVSESASVSMCVCFIDLPQLINDLPANPSFSTSTWYLERSKDSEQKQFFTMYIIQIRFSEATFSHTMSRFTTTMNSRSQFQPSFHLALVRITNTIQVHNL